MRYNTLRVRSAFKLVNVRFMLTDAFFMFDVFYVNYDYFRNECSGECNLNKIYKVILAGVEVSITAIIS